MILRILRPAHQAGWAALLLACALSSACSSSSTPVPEAFVGATVGAGGNGVACNFASSQQWLDVGSVPPSPCVGCVPNTQKNGGSQNGNAVNVACTVAPSGNGFDLDLSATEEGNAGGSLVITSPAGQGSVTSTGGSGITAAFGSGAFGNYRSTDCTISFTYNGETVPTMPPIAAGRIWGHISCPSAQQSGKTRPNPDGGAAVTEQCDAEADFLFQECGQ
jgi:hypothetical protein